jgi:hypothetical protein
MENHITYFLVKKKRITHRSNTTERSHVQRVLESKTVLLIRHNGDYLPNQLFLVLVRGLVNFSHLETRLL